MSASLVGSEMCIRDRPRANSNLAGPLRRRCAGSYRSCCNHGGMPTPSSVSYTHLTLPTICSV
eukprot:3213530-Alexandrium_andersonii.AAC.1